MNTMKKVEVHESLYKSFFNNWNENLNLMIGEGLKKWHIYILTTCKST